MVFYAYIDTAMTLLMLFDAIRRRVDVYWYIIILMPLGQWIYFFAIKIYDYDIKLIKGMFATGPDVKDLRRALEETPSVDNKIALGRALVKRKELDEAEQLFAEILDRDDEDKEALYGMGLARVGQERLPEASDLFERVLELDDAFEDYEAWFDLAFAYWCQGKKTESVDALEKLATTSPRIKHKAILGKYLTRNKQKERAIEVLEETLEDYRVASNFVKRLMGKWASEARDTLKEARALK